MPGTLRRYADAGGAVISVSDEYAEGLSGFAQT
jgi:hypothetical protein